jgi:hypothetical protein
LIRSVLNKYGTVISSIFLLTVFNIPTKIGYNVIELIRVWLPVVVVVVDVVVVAIV